MKDTTHKDTMNVVDRMIGFLTMRYAFRYNTVMNCTEFRHTGSTEAHFEPLDPRTRRRKCETGARYLVVRRDA